MPDLSHTAALIGVVGVIAVLSLVVAPRRVSADGFFAGVDGGGAAPGLGTLVLSQVTTWIFARSLMNAAILGYYFGIAGTLAYTVYYGSFLTGGYIVARLRSEGGRSVQGWLGARFGPGATVCYNVVIALRLLSEVFANLLVIGLIAGAVLPAMPQASAAAILGFAGLALAYAALGGLRASLRTDVVQMAFFLGVLALALHALIFSPGFSLSAVLSAPGTAGSGPGWVLMAVAALQVFSYPVHDPVMMDRGFLADPRTTRLSFLHAFWISALCILGFGLFGVQAGLVGAAFEGELLMTWRTMFGPEVFLLLISALLVSALSTLDSALTSAARLSVEELRLLPRTARGGRIAMIAFAIAGTVLTLAGSQTLFDAVAVSGTASMFLTPVLVVSLVLGRHLAPAAYFVAFAASVSGAAAYFFRETEVMTILLPEAHKYTQLLCICVVVLVLGFLAAVAGAGRRISAR